MLARSRQQGLEILLLEAYLIVLARMWNTMLLML
jgi:hypothetical protein